MSGKIANVGMLGCGNISGIYIKNIISVFKNLRLFGVYDIHTELALNLKKQYDIPKAYVTYEEMLADPEIDIILNLTPPQLHIQTTSAALLAGKHVYTEKPLAISYDEGKRLSALAKKKNCILASGPDTFLGAGIQSSKHYIEEGKIGRIIGCSAHMCKTGMETWHPNPTFLYQKGAGPLWDMGPYYLTAIIQIMGRIELVSGMTSVAVPRRTITSQPHCGKIIDVTTPTYINSLLQFAGGAQGTLMTTFDVVRTQLPCIEIYGEEGTLLVPDPNTFGGPVKILLKDQDGIQELPLLYDYKDNSRGLGLSEMAGSIQENRICRTDHRQALHVLEVMEAIQKSQDERRHITIETEYIQPKAMIN